MTITSTNNINTVQSKMSSCHTKSLNEYFNILKKIFGIQDFENIIIILNDNIYYFFIPLNKNGYKFIRLALDYDYRYDYRYDYGYISIVKSCDILECNNSLSSHFEKKEFKFQTDIVFDKFHTQIKVNTRRFYGILLIVIVFLIILVFLVFLVFI